MAFTTTVLKLTCVASIWHISASHRAVVDLEPTLRGHSLSVVLPFHPAQAIELRGSVKSLRRHLVVDDLDVFHLVSPCMTEELVNAAADCALVTRHRMPNWLLNRTQSLGDDGLPKFDKWEILAELHANGGRIDLLTSSGGCDQVFSWLPKAKLRHTCDDVIACNKVRGCFPRDAHVPGWKVQQIIKLGISRWITSPHTLVLDADIIAVTEVSARTLLLPDGRSRPTMFGRVKNGTRIGSLGLTTTWEGLYERELRLLGADPDSAVSFDDAGYLAITPQVLSTYMVRRLLDKLEDHHQKSYADVLATTEFTEYTLYNTHLLLEWKCVGRRVHYFYDHRTLQLAIGARDLKKAALVESSFTYKYDFIAKKFRHEISQYTDDLFAVMSPLIICHGDAGFTPAECRAIADLAATLIREFNVSARFNRSGTVRVDLPPPCGPE